MIIQNALDRLQFSNSQLVRESVKIIYFSIGLRSRCFVICNCCRGIAQVVALLLFAVHEYAWRITDKTLNKIAAQFMVCSHISTGNFMATRVIKQFVCLSVNIHWTGRCCNNNLANCVHYININILCN